MSSENPINESKESTLSATYKIMEKQPEINQENRPLFTSKPQITRQERRLAEREAAKLAKKKSVPNAKGLHTLAQRETQINNLIEQLMSLEVYEYLPAEMTAKLLKHASTGETVEEDYPINEVGRTLEIRFYNSIHQRSYSNFRNTAAEITDAKQMEGYKRLEARMEALQKQGLLGSK
jgi:hypothetical protein